MMLLLPSDLANIGEELRTKVERLQRILNYTTGETVITEMDVKTIVDKLYHMVLELFQYVYHTPYNTLDDDTALSMVQALTDFVWMRGVTPMGNNISWNVWYESKLGILVRGVLARYKLNTGKPLNAKELAILAGTSVANIVILLKRKRIIGERRSMQHRGGFEWLIPPKEAKEHLSRGSPKVTPQVYENIIPK